MKKSKIDSPGVILIGDELSNQKAIEKVIAQQGITVTIHKLSQSIAENVKGYEPFLLIIDIEGSKKAGIAAERICEAIALEIPQLIISDQKNLEALSKDGIIQSTSDFMIKPLNASLLTNKIITQRDLFERRQELKAAVEELNNKRKIIADDQQKLRILTTAVSEPIIFVDQNLNISFVNQEVQNVFGYSWYEAVTESFTRWMVAPKSHSLINDLFEKALKSGNKQLKRNQQFTMRNKLKVEIEVDATVSYHKIGEKEFNLVFVIHDRSKDKRLERETIRSRELKEENKLIREFVRHISLDFQTPLNVMLGITETLKSVESEKLNERQLDGLNILNQSGNHLMELVNDLKDISKLDSKKLKVNPESFDFDKMLAWHKSQTYHLIKDKAIKLFFKKSPSIPSELIGDIRKINQILTELLTNAVRYTEKGRIILSSHLIDNKLFIEITDTGKGIPKNILNNFKSDINKTQISDIKSTGTELGLPISRKLIGLMNGEITVESEKGKGTIFRFYIPINYKSKLDARGVTPKEISSEVTSYGYIRKSKLVLIVDDSPENAFFYSVLAEDDEYSVIQVKNGKKAPAAIREFSPDLLILKMEMPGLHGTSIVRELRNKHIKIPVIALSEFNKLPGLAAYNVQLIAEPLSIDVLLNTIENRIRWYKKTSIESVVIFEDESWIKSEVERYDDGHFINNSFPELSFIQIAQKNPDYLVFENVEKTSNSLPLMLKIIAELGTSNFKEIYLQYEGIPMKYLLKKIEGFPNIRLITRKEMAKLDFLK